MSPLRETAEAKLNLTLRILGRRADGYHELRSLVAFARIGDTLQLELGPDLSLSIEGPFGGALAQEDRESNLILRAARRLQRSHPGLRSGAFRLVKNLPVAAGIGGGSADAGAALRLLLRANTELGLEEAAAICRELGADVPVCFLSRAAYMWGTGDMVQPLDPLPEMPVVLANPDQALSTAKVFSILGAPSLPPDAARVPPVLPAPFPDADALIAYLRDEKNDLQPPATQLAPVIGDVLSALQAAPGCRLARLSGSGATCFGIFANAGQAAEAAGAIGRTHPDWWVVASELHGSGANTPG